MTSKAINAVDCFLMYTAMKAHFNQKTYDYFKYNGKLRVSASKFETRKDKYFFKKLEKHPDPLGFLLSNFLHNQSFWIGEISQNAQSEEVYSKWKNNIQSLSYNFKQQITSIFEKYTLHELIKIPENGQPKIITAYCQNEISLETLIIFAECCKCCEYWNKWMKNDVLWESIAHLMFKYRPFLKFDKEVYDKTLKTLIKTVDKIKQ